MKLSTSFDFSKVKFDQENNLNLLVKAEAPKMTLGKRPKVNLVLVLDVSTSMGGQKIDYVKKSALKLADQLSEDDTLSLISFDSYVKTHFQPSKMDAKGKTGFKAAVEQLRSTGCTNFSGALLEGFNHVAGFDGDTRILILTDGQPSTGETRQDVLCELVKSKLPKNATLSTFGYGDDHYSDFLSKLADLGRGNYAYVKNPDDALIAFARELGGLMSCYSQNLVFTIKPEKGVTIEDVLSDVDSEDLGDKGLRITVTDLYSEEVRNIVLKVKTSKLDKAQVRAGTVATVDLEWTSPSDGEKHHESAKAKLHFVKDKDAQKDPDKDVMEQVTLCNIIEAQKQAFEAAKSGNFAGAQNVLRSVNMAYASGDMAAYMVNTSSAMMDSMTLTSNTHNIQASLSSFKKGRSSGEAGGLYTSNSVQADLEKKFKDGDTTSTGAAAGSGVIQNTGQTITISDGTSTLGIVPQTQTTAPTLLGGTGQLGQGQGHFGQGNIFVNPAAPFDPSWGIQTPAVNPPQASDPKKDDKKKLTRSKSDRTW